MASTVINVAWEPGDRECDRRVEWRVATTPEVVSGFEHPPMPPGAVELGDFLSEFLKRPEIAEHVPAARTQMAENVRTRRGGDTLKSLRLAAGLSQIQFAEALGTSQSHVSRLEARAEKPGEDMLRRLAVVLAVNFDTLMDALARGGK